MTDAERLKLCQAENRRLQGEVDTLRTKAAQWEEQSEKMTKKYLETLNQLEALRNDNSITDS